jgi:hypothetical protein
MELTDTRFSGTGFGTDVLSGIERSHLSMDRGRAGATMARTRGSMARWRTRSKTERRLARLIRSHLLTLPCQPGKRHHAPFGR